MPNRNLLPDLFKAIDAKDTPRFLSFIADDGVFRFGSVPPVKGRKAIGAAVDLFFESIAASRHTVAKTWDDNGTIVCEGEVRYQRHNGTSVLLPFVDVLEFAGDLISSYRIYIDIAPLYAE